MDKFLNANLLRPPQKPKAVRASVPDLRQSIDMANDLMRGGVAFVCVPYFTEEQKVFAANIAAKNLNSVDLGGEDGN